MAQATRFKLDISNPKRTVIATKTDINPYPQAQDEILGYHHMFYADANGEPCAIMETIEGLVCCLTLAYWSYRFVGRDEIGKFPEAAQPT